MEVKFFGKSRIISVASGIILLLSVITGFSQTEVINAIKKNFDQYRSQTFQEKLYVHTDKSFYVAGEIMWFKIYAVDGVFNKPVDLSKIAYVDIIDRDQKPILQAKVALGKGDGSGSFFVPLSIKSGNYRLRAYTSWMKNFSADYYFEKDITVINSLKKLSEKPAAISSNYEIHFFPEGGNLVMGLESVVGCKVTDASGNGVNDFRGSIVDQNNNTITIFGPHKFGMGRFRFTPTAGNKYSAIIKVGNNNAVVADLPNIFNQGYVMKMEDDGKDTLHVTVSTNISFPDHYVYLFAHTRQIIKIALRAPVINGKAEFTISKKIPGEGVTQFTVFNYSQQPVCERLFFKRPASLNIIAESDQSEYAPRKKVTVSVRAQNAEGSAAPDADMSMSVYMVDSLQMAQQSNILSYLWLSSDISGRIESPDYYFNNPEEEVSESIDNLLLTQGWRRFRWEDISQNKTPYFEFVPEYEGHIINGKITSKKTGLPVENIATYLSAPGQKFQIGTAVSNKNGLIQFDLRNFYGSNEIVLQTVNGNDSGNRIEIFSPFSEKYSGNPVPIFTLSETLQQDLLYHSVGMQVQNAYLNESLQKFDIPKIKDSTAFYGEPDKKYFLDDYTRYNTMEEVMREYVSYVSVHKRQQKFYFKVLNAPHQLFFEEEPLMLLDGVVVPDGDKLMNYDPLKVKKIEVVGREYFLGPTIANGIISYTTYKGDLDGFQIDPNAVVLEYEGLQLQREFYSPVYETAMQVSSRMPDFRNLLYWSPNIKTGSLGNRQVSFYSSDRQGKYLVVLNGITASGQAGSKAFTFEVAKP